MNKTTVSGRLLKDPVVRYTPNSKILCRFTLAVQREYKNAEGNYDADYIPVVLWSNSAEVAGNNLAKGNKILVEGCIHTRSYLDKQNEKHWVTELIARRFEYMFTNPAAFADKYAEDEENPFENMPMPDIDNIPF